MKRGMLLLISSVVLACGAPGVASANDADDLRAEMRLLISMEDRSVADQFWHIWEETGSTEAAFAFVMNHAMLSPDLKWAMQSPMERLRNLGLRETLENE